MAPVGASNLSFGATFASSAIAACTAEVSDSTSDRWIKAIYNNLKIFFMQYREIYTIRFDFLLKF